MRWPMPPTMILVESNYLTYFNKTSLCNGTYEIKILNHIKFKIKTASTKLLSRRHLAKTKK